MGGGALRAETPAQARTPEWPGVAGREAGGGGAGGCVQARGVGVTGCGGARCLGGAGSGVGEGAGAPRCGGRRAARLGDSEGRARRRRSGGSGGCAAAGAPGGETGLQGDAAAGPGAGGGGAGRRARLGRAAGAGQGLGVSWPGGRGGPRRRGRRGAGAARRPLLPPGLELSGLGGGCSGWEVGAGGGRGWLHRGSHSASSSRRRRHCVLSARVARCGASGGGGSRRPRAEDPALALCARAAGLARPGGGRGPRGPGHPPLPWPGADAGALRAEVPGAPAGRAQRPRPGGPGGPCGCVCWRAVPRGCGRAFKRVPAQICLSTGARPEVRRLRPGSVAAAAAACAAPGARGTRWPRGEGAPAAFPPCLGPRGLSTSP